MANRDRDPARSSVAMGGAGRGGRKKGMLPLVLGALTLLLLALAIGLLSCGGDDEVDTTGAVAIREITGAADAPAPSSPRPNGEAAEETPGGTTGPTGASGATGATGATGAGGQDGELSAEGALLLGREAASIQEHVGEDATGRNLRVISVVDSGFFVGTDERDRQFVEYAGDVGEDEADQELPKEGDVVSLEGPIRRAPRDPARTLKLEGEDAELVEQRGAYVNADSVEQADG